MRADWRTAGAGNGGKHADLITPPQQQRAAALHLSVALQPAFLDWAQEPGEYLERILGRERTLAIEPLREMLAQGLLLSAGSDAPCTLPNPVEGIHLCCNHPDPAQSVTVEQALKIHTLWAAKTAFDENDLGSLTPGKLANFTLLAQNPLTMPVENLRDNHVLGLYLRGRKAGPQRCGLVGLVCRSLWNRLAGRRLAD